MTKILYAKEFDCCLKNRQDEVFPGFKNTRRLDRSPFKNQFEIKVDQEYFLLELQWSASNPGQYTFNVVAFIEDSDDLSQFKIGGSALDFDNRIKSFYRLGCITNNQDKWWILKDPKIDGIILRSISPKFKEIDLLSVHPIDSWWYPSSFEQPIQEIINNSLSDLKGDVESFLTKIK
jgi:Domain of unknown function (DUF4304)